MKLDNEITPTVTSPLYKNRRKTNKLADFEEYIYNTLKEYIQMDEQEFLSCFPTLEGKKSALRCYLDENKMDPAWYIPIINLRKEIENRIKDIDSNAKRAFGWAENTLN